MRVCDADGIQSKNEKNEKEPSLILRRTHNSSRTPLVKASRDVSTERLRRAAQEASENQVS